MAQKDEREQQRSASNPSRSAFISGSPPRPRHFVEYFPSFLIGCIGTTTVFAQGSPFETGANSLVVFLQTIGTPIAAIIVIVLAIAAAIGKMSWGWVIGALIGIAAIFGAPTIVEWIRQMFAV
jgi:type IV secretion system protein VirB2